MIINTLVFGADNFNKTLNEITNKLSFNLIIYSFKDGLKLSNQNYDIILIDNEFLQKQKKVESIKFEKFNLPVLLLIDSQNKVPINCLFNDQMYFPLNILDLKKKVNDLLATYKFNKNSAVNIKNYLIDKNLKTMTKNYVTINLTEKEVNLLVLLNEENRPLNKTFILKKVWQYSVDADTHTVETHIYRLRKKVLDKFGDREFINILNKGYSL